MAWETLSLHFKQTYEGGYRYLDKCGELMLAAMRNFDAIPGEAKPTGARMEIPERGVTINCDALSLSIGQELPGKDMPNFLKLCLGMSESVKKLFEPSAVVRNGFACKSFWSFTNVDDMLAASLKFGGNFYELLGKTVDMVPAHKKLDYNLSSGSRDLNVSLEPVTFELASMSLRNVAHNATRAEKSRIDRGNRFKQQLEGKLSHALVMVVDSTEKDPPEEANVLERHFSDLMAKSEALIKLFSLK